MRKNLFRALAFAVAGSTMAASLSSCSLGGGMTISADLKSASGVFVGNDVGILGVPVGKITEIKPMGDHVKVTMQIDDGRHVPAGAAAVVVSRSVATDRYIELTPVYHAGDPQMKDGAEIPSDRTMTPVDFDEVLGTIGKFSDEIAGSGATANAISRLIASQANAFQGRGLLVNQAIHGLGTAVGGISAQRDAATSTVVALDQLTTTLAQNQATIREFVDQVSQATALLAAERDNFKTALESSTQMVQTVAQFAQDNRAGITQAVGQINGVGQTILDKKEQVGEILRDMPLALQNVQRATGADNRLRVRLDLLQTLPVLGGIAQTICNSNPGVSTLCTSLGLGTLSPGQLTGVLQGLLGGSL